MGRLQGEREQVEHWIGGDHGDLGDTYHGDCAGGGDHIDCVGDGDHGDV